MTRLIVVAHRPLASALGEVARHAFPDALDQVRWVDVAPDWSLERTEAEVASTYAELVGDGDDGVLLLTDVPGATPANAAQRAAHGRHARVLAGVSVPMLWRALCYREEPLPALLDRAREGAARGVCECVAESRPEPGCGPVAR